MSPIGPEPLPSIPPQESPAPARANGDPPSSTPAPTRVAATLLDPLDDVATALQEIPAGTAVTVACAGQSHAVVIGERIPAGHKFAVRALDTGVLVRKYGEFIGRTTRAVPLGGWVHEHNLVSDADRSRAGEAATADRSSGRAKAEGVAGAAAASSPRPRAGRADDPRSTATGAPRTFSGYRRADGRVGVRNHVLVLSPTGLTSAAAQRIGGLVRGTVCVTSGYGRGQVAADAKLQFDTLAGLALNPNVAAVVVLAAGDDIVGDYVNAIAAAGKPVTGLSLPGAREDALTLVDAGMRAAARYVHAASRERRVPCDLADLCIAVECGHSDATSGLVCNPLAGRIMEGVVAAGGRGMFSETVEWTGTEHLLAQRATTPDVAQRIVAAVAERERMVRAAGGDIRAQNPGPQNKAGGITTIEEKALGAIAKGGRQTIRDVLRPAQRPPGPGMYLMDTPYFSPESITAMVASGAQIVLFTTGAGNSYCSLIAPTMKMSAHPATCAHLTEQIDFPAADVLAGTATLEELAAAGLKRVLEIAGGTLTFGEIVGEGSEVVSRLGPSI